MRLHIGLTGGIGSGKSTVAAMLAELGAVVIDSDVLARQVVAPGTEGLRRLAQAFGPAVFTVDGELDRKSLARVVFADQDALDQLNAIVHPLVRSESARLIASAPADAIVVSDVPLLVENDMQGAFDVVLVVLAPLDVRLARLAERGLDAQEARARIANQADDERRRAVADVVLDNGGDQDRLRAQVKQFWSSLVTVEPGAGSRTGLE